MLAHRRRVRLVRPISPFFDAISEDLHRRYPIVAQAGVTGDLTADACALVAHHLAHAFQFADDLVDFHERHAGDAPDYCIEFFGGAIFRRTPALTI
jgi:hypothetical protein